MSLLTKQEQLRQLIEEQQERIRQTFPARRGSAVLALARARDWQYLTLQETPDDDAHNSYTYPSGWHKALQLCFSDTAESAYASSPVYLHPTLEEKREPGDTPGTPAGNSPVPLFPDWADEVLLECDRLVKAEQVLAYCESGFMRMQQGGEQDFYAWIAGKKMPTEWRERADLAWWTNALARTYERERQELTTEYVSIQQQVDTLAGRWQTGASVYRTTPEIDDYYLRLGRLRVKEMACHLLYPDHTLIGGCAIGLYRNVLATIIGYALKHLELCRSFAAQRPAYPLRALLAPPQDTAALIEAVSETLGAESAAIHRAVDAYCLDHGNVSYHCSAAGTPVEGRAMASIAPTLLPSPPLLRLDEQHLAWSLAGLTSEPFLFLTRELKRRYSYEYHTASHRHEEVFRQDLYHLFADKRFVRSASSIELRGVQGDLTTDVDALIFDRKTGALALFELKSQDPFAYSRQERIRQRDYFYGAGKQVLACVQWLNRHGANVLLTRLDQKLVKRLKVQKTYIFVLGRYLAHFFDGPEFDRRAAWGTWPQVLRLVKEGPFGTEEANPMQSLYSKLVKDTPLALSDSAPDVQEIPVGERTIYVYPDFQTYKNRVG